jgi:tetratricopeptide (TPR) repeat protein
MTMFFSFKRSVAFCCLGFSVAVFAACRSASESDSASLRSDPGAFNTLRRIKAAMDESGALPIADFDTVRSLREKYPHADEPKQAYRQALMIRGNWPALETDLESISRGEMTADERILLARTYGKLGKYREAAAELEPMVEADPEDVAKRGMLALAYFHLDRPDQAAAQLDRVWDRIVAEKKLEEITLRGLIYLRLGDVPRSIETLKQAIEIDPASSPAHSALSRAYAQAGNEELADLHRSRAAEQNQIAAAATFAASRRVNQVYQLEAAWKTKDYARVVELANEMLAGADAPQRSVLYQYIFEAQKALGNQTEATKALEAARRLQQK